MEKQHAIQKILSEELLIRGVSLDDVGFRGYAWKWQDALEVLSVLHTKRIPILGGDVYLIVDGRVTPTMDNWFINRENFTLADSFLNNSHKQSADYITAYMKRNGDSYYYSIIVYTFPVGINGASL